MKTSDAIHASELTVQAQRRAWINALLCIGLMVILVVTGQLAIQLYTRSGWMSQDIAVAALAVDGQGRVWVVDSDGGVWVAEGTRLVSPFPEFVEVPLSDGDRVKCLAIEMMPYF